MIKALVHQNRFGPGWRALLVDWNEERTRYGVMSILPEQPTHELAVQFANYEVAFARLDREKADSEQQ